MTPVRVRTLANDQWPFAAHKGRVADQDAGDVSNRVVRSCRKPTDSYAHLTRTSPPRWLWGAIVRHQIYSVRFIQLT